MLTRAQLRDIVVLACLRQRDMIATAWEKREKEPGGLRRTIVAIMERRKAVHVAALCRWVPDIHDNEAAIFMAAQEVVQNQAIVDAEDELRRNLQADEVTGSLLSASAQAAEVMKTVCQQLRRTKDWLKVVKKHQAALARVLALKAEMTSLQSMQRDRLLDVLIDLCHDAACRGLTDTNKIHDLLIDVWKQIAGPEGMFFIAEQPTIFVVESVVSDSGAAAA